LNTPSNNCCSIHACCPTQRHVLPYPAPRSTQGRIAAQQAGGANLSHQGDADEDTGNFGPRSGNLRVDYVLPSRQFEVVNSGIFWPAPGETGADWIEVSDHRLVWLDLQPAATAH